MLGVPATLLYPPPLRTPPYPIQVYPPKGTHHLILREFERILAETFTKSSLSVPKIVSLYS